MERKETEHGVCNFIVDQDLALQKIKGAQICSDISARISPPMRAGASVQNRGVCDRLHEERSEQRPRIMRKPETLNMVGLSDPTIWRMEKDGKFPKRIRLGGNSCGWLESEVMGWLAERIAARG